MDHHNKQIMDDLFVLIWSRLGNLQCLPKSGAFAKGFDTGVELVMSILTGIEQEINVQHTLTKQTLEPELAHDAEDLKW